MKKIILGLTGVLLSFSVHAELCVVNPTSSRYHVDTYIRNQTSCVNTQHAHSSVNVGKVVIAAAAILIIAKVLDKIKDAAEHQAFEQKITSDPNSKVYSCNSVKILTTSHNAYVDFEGRFYEFSEFSQNVFQRKEDEGIMRFDANQLKFYIQRWNDRTARGGNCKFESNVAA